MRRGWTALLAALVAVVFSSVAVAQDLRALARVDATASAISDAGPDVTVTLVLSQPVPFRPHVSFDPATAVIAFREVVFEPEILQLDRSEKVQAVRYNQIEPGWSQLILDLTEPMALATADLSVDEVAGTARLLLRLRPATQSEVAAKQAAPVLPSENTVSKDQDGPLVVVLDPGHGGVDPGAQIEGVNEADLMLTFARELREILIRAGYDVLLTRNDDSFVSLPARVSIARAAGADVFISLHADALLEGRALGTSLYTLSDKASDAASAALAERQDRSDLLAGVDLTAQDDQIATVLMDLARRETKPRTDALADAIITALEKNAINLYKRPKSQAGFSVLKAPDIPSVLIELGFLSSKADLEKISDAAWRSRFAIAISEGLALWAFEDAARAERLRK